MRREWTFVSIWIFETCSGTRRSESSIFVVVNIDCAVATTALVRAATIAWRAALDVAGSIFVDEYHVPTMRDGSKIGSGVVWIFASDCEIEHAMKKTAIRAPICTAGRRAGLNANESCIAA